MGGIRVLIVDDHALFAEALAVRLGAEPDLDVRAVAFDARRAGALLSTERPDVVVLDLTLGQDSGFEVLERVRDEHPGTRVVMLTAVPGSEAVTQAVRRGAVAWLPKTTSADELARVIRGVMRGEAWIPPRLLADVLRRLAEGEPEPERADPLAVLTARERQVLQCMVDGLSRPEIAEALGMSVHTVRTHTQNIMGKLDVRTALEAITIALRAQSPSA
ncbi:response regulator [Bailinhaonella thermotolerans]|uniref:DNA-binding response regulator n=1 Tax=Bailinhaonella thermotolerans TaxID=1070861 RepID=A0A3A4BHY5_9ACTN|nr:response regulator transcription factor [Bailinhaonella thermotolerans]RJL30872.1 DNA-binding response regulator [Bailinhaonella thermotolerans]